MLVARLLPLFPPHRYFADLFGGGGSVLLAKKPAEHEVYNDLDGELANFFRVLRDPALFSQFELAMALTPVSREEFLFCRDSTDALDPVERARRFMVRARQSFSGMQKSWTFSRTATRRGMSLTVSHWLSAIEGLPKVHERLSQVLIENTDWAKVFERYVDERDAFCYLDPPYVLETRRGGGYKHEFNLAQHEELVRTILPAQCAVMLSGYAHPVYQPLEDEGWKRVDFRIVCYAMDRKEQSGEKDYRTESVWMNYQVKPHAIPEGVVSG